MRRFFVAIYDYLFRHRFVAISMMVLLLVVEVLLGLRLGFKENAADFLPQDDESQRYMSVYENMSGQNRITVLFRSSKTDEDEGRYAIVEAVEMFESVCDSLAEAEGEDIDLQCYVDEDMAFDAMDYMRNNIALFLSPDDYRRIDSLLAIPGYVDSCLSSIKHLMAFPMGGIAQQVILSDPLSLFTPAFLRLESLSPSSIYSLEEGVLFDSDGVGYAFLDSPYGSSETKGNSRIANILEHVSSIVTSSSDSVAVSAIGAPLIAVGNASQIKRDSFFAMLLSVVLITIILIFALRRFRNIALLSLSVLAGWLFALAAVSLFSPSISVIVIGIGSVLIGIAVNYPLHFLERLNENQNENLSQKAQKNEYENQSENSRETLKEMVEPLVTGNITTVSAFACLIFINSSAMHDLGLFGATMLVGTILFVMLFLPLLTVGRKRGEEHVSRKPLRACRLHRSLSCLCTISCKQGGLRTRPFVLLAVVALTVWLAIHSTNPSFDDNLQNINYITASQSADLRHLESALSDTGMQVEYVVSKAATLDDALRMQELLFSNSAMTSKKGALNLMPSTASQDSSIMMWRQFMERYAGLGALLQQKASQYGFSQTAFEAFTDALEKNYAVVDPVEMTPLKALADAYISGFDSVSDGGMVMTMLSVPKESAETSKLSLRQNIESDDLFVFDINDVGNNMVRSLNFDFNYILYVCGFVVFFFLWLSFGRIELALLAFLPLAVAWLWILGIMDIASVKFNIVNIILATFIFGQGDDYTIFITEGLIYENAYGKRRLKSYRRSVIISALLMFVGIGSLIFSKHPAMRSLAEVAMIGMAVVVLMACYLPPLVFRWLTQKKGMLRQVPVTLGRLFNTLLILLVFFVAAFVLVTPYTFIYRLIGRDSEAKRLRFHRMIQRFTAAAVRLLPGVKFRVENPNNEDFSKPAVIIANHQSHLDLLCMLQLTPKLVILTADWVWKNPIYGAIIRYAEYYPVHDGYETLAPKLKSLVDRGYSVVVFPEGTRSVTGEIGRFRKGAFQLAQQLGIDVLPVFLHGGCHVMPKDDILLRNGQLTVEIGERIDVSRFTFDVLKCRGNVGDVDSARLFASEMHKYYIEHFAEMRRRLEDELYWFYFVRSQYLYKGREVERRARQNLKAYFNNENQNQNDYFSQKALKTQKNENDNQNENEKQNAVDKAGQGEVPLLKALAHPDEHFSYNFENEDDYLICRNIVERLNITNLELCQKF